MKSLILKDLYNIGHNMKSMLLVLVILAVGLISSAGTESYVVASGVICGTMVITTFSFDNMSKWPRYAMIMPVSRKDLVASKFIVLLIFAVGGAIAGLVLGAGGGVLLHKLVLNTEGILTLLQLSLIGLLYTVICGSISIPLVFKFGAERARMLMFASFIAPSAIFYGIYKLLVGMGIDLSEDMIPMLLCIAPVVVVIWVAVMFKLSCHIFSKQEL